MVCLVISLVFWSQNYVFSASPRKAMQNNLEITSKSKFWITFVYVTHFSYKSSFLTSRNRCLIENRVLQISGRNTLENAYKITSKSKFSTQNVQIPYHLHPALCNSLICKSWRPQRGSKARLICRTHKGVNKGICFRIFCFLAYKLKTMLK